MGCVSSPQLPSQCTVDVAAWKANSIPRSSGGGKSKIERSAGLESPWLRRPASPLCPHVIFPLWVHPDTSSSHGDPRQIGPVHSLMASFT